MRYIDIQHCASLCFIILFIYLLAALCPRCSMWDLVPWSGIEPRPPALVGGSLSHWTSREVQCCHFWCVAKGPRKVARLATLPFSVCICNKLSESTSNWCSFTSWIVQGLVLALPVCLTAPSCVTYGRVSQLSTMKDHLVLFLIYH